MQNDFQDSQPGGERKMQTAFIIRPCTHLCAQLTMTSTRTRPPAGTSPGNRNAVPATNGSHLCGGLTSSSSHKREKRKSMEGYAELDSIVSMESMAKWGVLPGLPGRGHGGRIPGLRHGSSHGRASNCFAGYHRSHTQETFCRC